ncbi:extracellular calcium-sensing receptor-like [Ambystoma mexicanum]|uniref:extracellular calcium-sensing receptor-like n=1 Tax=Ambystoma mexicanum TaxID=8296 RepID=UPI0037E79B07
MAAPLYNLYTADCEEHLENSALNPPKINSIPVPVMMFSYGNFQWLQAMVFAIEQINGNPGFLPNITLGFHIYDSCMRMQRALEGTLWMLTEQKQPIPNYRCRGESPLVGIVGDAVSFYSVLIAHVLGLYGYTQISYFSTNPVLSDRNQFPSFFRTIPSDDFQARGLARMVIYFGWTWVGLIAADNEYGQQGIHIVQQELVKAGICIAFSETVIKNEGIPNARYIAKVIKHSTANAIVIFSSEIILSPLMDELVQQNATGKIWIATESWSTSSLLSAEKYSSILSGAIGFAIHSEDMPGFKEYLTVSPPAIITQDIFMKEFWERVFNCAWLDGESVPASRNDTPKACSWHEKRAIHGSFYNELINPRVTYNIYSAVYALALALQDLHSCMPGRGPFQQGTCANILDFKPWQLLHYVKRMRFPHASTRGQFFDSEGNPPARYDIVNWQQDGAGALMHVKVGLYDSSAPAVQTFTIRNSAIRWAAGSTQMPASKCSPSCPPGTRMAAIQGKPLCCFECAICPQAEISNQSDSIDCSTCLWNMWPNERQDQCIPKTTEFLSYEETLGVTLASASIFSSMIPVAILGLFFHYRNTPIVRANNRSLSYLLLLSLTLCFLCSLAFIGYPTPEKCLLRQAAFGITFALCVSCILAKTIMVVIAFNATKPNSDMRRWVGPKMSYMVISVGTFIQVILCFSWLIHSTPFSEYNTHTHPGKIIVECNEKSPIAFWCMLGYLGVLATISFIVAFLARKLPDNFNEAQFITFSMLAFLSVWISFIPAYLSTKGKYMVAMETFAILTSGSALLCCIFLPKCYIILLRPEMNSREHLMGRGKSHTIDIQ